MRTLITLCAALALGLPQPVRADAAEDALDQLNQRNIEFTPEEFLDVVQRGDVENVKSFLGAGMDPNTADKRKATALMQAAIRGHAETVRALLEGRALPDLKNPRGWTALHLGAFFAFPDVVTALIEGKADLMAENEYGMTAMHLAVQGRQTEIAMALARAGADPTAVSHSGVSPLSIALETGQKDLLKFFTARGHGGRIAALKAKFAAELKATDKESKDRERDRKAKLRKALEAAGGARGPNAR